ncbi:syntaxin-31 isoform X2 [Macadamia integrifolia]|uniref:syntaxin-31 isoform X2 n=1 Tax=Macadamia integrifolia TaxID=60698 RepID=UPI001C4E3A50|nr:syntaxin-31 isoform X2 [Macadamia integrifolia]
MASAGVSLYRDRTSEFRLVSERLKKIERLADVPGTGNDPETLNASPASSSRSEFKKIASRIGLGIHETSLKISRLAKLAKKSSMFDDPVVEIQELTALIKDDITALNIAVSDLQTLQNLEIDDGNYSKDRVVHGTTVCDDLKNKLMATTKQFQDVLTARTENVKAHENRKQIFSTNASRENPFLQKNNTKTVTEPPPWSNKSNPSSVLPPLAVPSSGLQNGNQLRRRLATDSTPSQHMEASMLQEVIPRRENYTQSRALALQNVESTISELSGIFTHLATMVAHQGELAIRIDDNMEESLVNVEGAHSALLKHLNRISSNRGLLIKIFAVLIFFLIVFIFFMA